MWLDTDRGCRIPAFHIRRGRKLTLLVSHANAEDLGIVLQYWSWLAEALQVASRSHLGRISAASWPHLAPPTAAQVDVFAYEYSGYGQSTGGTPCEQNLYADARAALTLLRDGFGLKPERDVVLYGKSLGSCPTSYLAGRNLVRGVIIVCGLASGARVILPTTKMWVTDALYFNNLGHLAGNKSPVQLVHGTEDEVRPSPQRPRSHVTTAEIAPR